MRDGIWFVIKDSVNVSHNSRASRVWDRVRLENLELHICVFVKEFSWEFFQSEISTAIFRSENSVLKISSGPKSIMKLCFLHLNAKIREKETTVFWFVASLRQTNSGWTWRKQKIGYLHLVFNFCCTPSTRGMSSSCREWNCFKLTNWMPWYAFCAKKEKQAVPARRVDVLLDRFQVQRKVFWDCAAVDYLRRYIFPSLSWPTEFWRELQGRVRSLIDLNLF